MGVHLRKLGIGPPVRQALNRKEEAQWLLHELAGGHGLSNLVVALRAGCHLRWWPLQQAVETLVRRHEVLRSQFVADGVTARRRLVPPDQVTVTLEVQAATEASLESDLQAIARAPFDLERDLLIRVHQLVLPEVDVICVVVHHLVFDGASAGILINELATLYDRFASNGAVGELAGPLAMGREPPPSEEAITYWVEQLHDADPAALVLDGARPPPALPTFAGARVRHVLSERAMGALRWGRGELHATDNIIMMSAFCLLLLRHGAGPDLVIGVPSDARRGPAMRGSIGFHVNTLPLRVLADPRSSFRELVRRTRDRFLEGLKHDSVSFESILPRLGHQSGSWRTPMFRHMFNFRPPGAAEVEIGGSPASILEVDTGFSRLDLELVVTPFPDTIELAAVHSTEVHSSDDIRAMLARLDTLLQSAQVDPDRTLTDMPMLTGHDQAVIERANDTGASAAPADHLLQSVLGQARATPEAVAVVDDGRAATYGELLELVQTTRERLRQVGVAPGDVVGLGARRGIELAVAVLATWAEGAAYLPLDPAHPAERLRFQLDDAGVRVVACHDCLPRSSVSGRRLVAVPDTTPPGTSGPQRPVTLSGADLAYLIYTSGSTGQPKAVMVEHRSLANLVHHLADLLEVAAHDTVLWLTTFAFDISALELLMPLCRGARVAVAGDDLWADPAGLLRLVRERRTSVAQATPTAWRLVAGGLSGELSGVRVLCGGEPLSATLAARLLSDGARLFNAYGPTETTIWSTIAELRPPVEDPLPIGLPIAATGAHVVDRYGAVLPPGLHGELYLTGLGLARGYHGQPDLTAERFIDHPVLGRSYRTGDIVRRRPDGLLEFHGRIDRQIKLRGHRLELGEVEAVLERHPGVEMAAAAVRHGPDGGDALVLFVQAQPASSEALAGELLEFARSHLPVYAVPSYIRVLEALPRTANGKIDYRALPEHLAPSPAEMAVPAPHEDPLVEALVRLYRDVLDSPRMTSASNFLLEGGHSLLAARLATLVEEELGLSMPVESVFLAPTPLELAAMLRQRSSVGSRP